MGDFQVAVYQCEARDDHPSRRLERLAERLTALDSHLVDLIVCPELFLSGYNSGEGLSEWREASNGEFARGVSKLARSSGLAIAYGYPETGGDGACYNAVALFDRSGTLLANHRKLRLPTAYEQHWFVPGLQYTLVDVGKLRLAILVCYDVEFPETVRACALAGAQLVIVPTALTDAWDVVATKVVPARAFENNIFLAYANYAGRDDTGTYLGSSCIVGPDGRDLARAGRDEEVIVADIDLARIGQMRKRLPYLTDCRSLNSLPIG